MLDTLAPLLEPSASTGRVGYDISPESTGRVGYVISSEFTGRVGYDISVPVAGERMRVGGETNMRATKLVRGVKRLSPPTLVGSPCCSMEFCSWVSIRCCLVLGDGDRPVEY